MNLRRPALQTKWIVDRQHRKMKGRAYEYGWDFESLVAANEMCGTNVGKASSNSHVQATYVQVLCTYYV